MLKERATMEIAILKKQGHSLREIAKITGYSINTIRKYPDGGQPAYKTRPLQKQKLEPYKKYIIKRLKAAAPAWIPATVIYREILSLGYPGKIRQVSSFMASLKPANVVELVVRFETEPGLQMQVDWAHFKEGEIKLFAFIATLGYSRASFVDFAKHYGFIPKVCKPYRAQTKG